MSRYRVTCADCPKPSKIVFSGAHLCRRCAEKRTRNLILDAVNDGHIRMDENGCLWPIDTPERGAERTLTEHENAA